MSIVFEYRDKVPGGVHLQMCNELGALWTMTQHSEQANSNGSSISYETAVGENETIDRDVFIELDSYIFHVNTAMEYDSEYFQWCKDVKEWMADPGKKTVPEKYYKRCTELFLKKLNINYVPLGDKSFTLEGLRQYGVKLGMDDEAVYKFYFAQLGILYDNLISKELFTSDYYWDEFTRSSGHEHLLRFLQQGQRSIFWRSIWNMQRYNRVDRLSTYDENVSGANVSIQSAFVAT